MMLELRGEIGLGHQYSILANINLIMQSKEASCDRCLKKDPHFLPEQEVYQPIRKPESYLAKKFQELYKENEKLKQKKDKRLREYQKQKQIDETMNCTFQPHINTNQDYYLSSDSFLKREKDWKSSVEKKIAEKKAYNELKNKTTYTFKPKISEWPKQKSTASGYSKDQSVLGVSKHFGQKKSYRNIHNNQKQYQKMVRSTHNEPFKHRRHNSNFDESGSRNLKDSITFKKTRTWLENPEKLNSKTKVRQIIKTQEESNSRYEVTVKKVQQCQITQEDEQEEDLSPEHRSLCHSRAEKSSSVKIQQQDIVNESQVSEKLHRLAQDDPEDKEF